jgi:hypothetical protein
MQRTLTLQELEAQLLAPKPGIGDPTPPQAILQHLSDQETPGQPQKGGSPQNRAHQSLAGGQDWQSNSLPSGPLHLHRRSPLLALRNI